MLDSKFHRIFRKDSWLGFKMSKPHVHEGLNPARNDLPTDSEESETRDVEQDPPKKFKLPKILRKLKERNQVKLEPNKDDFARIAKRRRKFEQEERSRLFLQYLQRDKKGSTKGKFPPEVKSMRKIDENLNLELTNKESPEPMDDPTETIKRAVSIQRRATEREEKRRKKDPEREKKMTVNMAAINQSSLFDFVHGHAKRRDERRARYEEIMKSEHKKTVRKLREDRRKALAQEDPKRLLPGPKQLKRLKDQQKATCLLINDTISGSMVRVLTEELDPADIAMDRNMLSEMEIREMLKIVDDDPLTTNLGSDRFRKLNSAQHAKSKAAERQLQYLSLNGSRIQLEKGLEGLFEPVKTTKTKRGEGLGDKERYFELLAKKFQESKKRLSRKKILQARVNRQLHKPTRS